MRSRHYSPAWIWPAFKIPTITARNGVTVHNQRWRALPDDVVVGVIISALPWHEAGQTSLCVLASVAGLKLFLCAGPGPSDTGSTTEKPWEASSPRLETSTWCIISGVRCEMTKHAGMRMITPGRLRFRVFRRARQNCPRCFWTTGLAPWWRLEIAHWERFTLQCEELQLYFTGSEKLAQVTFIVPQVYIFISVFLGSMLNYNIIKKYL